MATALNTHVEKHGAGGGGGPNAAGGGSCTHLLPGPTGAAAQIASGQPGHSWRAAGQKPRPGVYRGSRGDCSEAALRAWATPSCSMPAGSCPNPGPGRGPGGRRWGVRGCDMEAAEPGGLLVSTRVRGAGAGRCGLVLFGAYDTVKGLLPNRREPTAASCLTAGGPQALEPPLSLRHC